MFYLRRAKLDDVPTLLKLARMVHFINLPPDRDIIAQKVTHSRNSFLRLATREAERSAKRAETPAAADTPQPEPTPDVAQAGGGQPELAVSGLGQTTLDSDLFIVVLEESDASGAPDSTGPLGTSQVLSRMGGPGNPNIGLKLEERRFHSDSLQTGTSHTVARLHLDDTGPTELGGLILQPSYRGHRLKLGKFLSLARFHFIGLHRGLFADRIVAEMMAAISADGVNLLWEHLGRRFVPLSYDEADRFCQYSREFITALLPKEDIYLSLLPPQARAGVGQVGPETVPARRMLERLGFAFRGVVDPFDGGPHLEAATDDIELVRLTQRRVLAPPGEPAPDRSRRGIVSTLRADGEFFAVDTAFGVEPDGRLTLSTAAAKVLGLGENAAVGVTPTDRDGPLPGAAAGEGGAP